MAPRSSARSFAITLALLSGAALCAGAPQEREPTLAQVHQAERDRERRECASEILRSLGLTPGGWVADIGTGAGYYAERLSSLVGAKGRVFAVEIDQSALSLLRQRFGGASLRNVVVVEGAVDDPRLTPGSLDAVLVMRTYHDMTHPRPMLLHMRRALKPGGRLVMVDYGNDRSQATDPREQQVSKHEISMSMVASELDDAAFEVVERRQSPCEVGTSAKLDRMKGDNLWLIVARRPLDSWK